jgi:hypothetical protein
MGSPAQDSKRIYNNILQTVSTTVLIILSQAKLNIFKKMSLSESFSVLFCGLECFGYSFATY